MSNRKPKVKGFGHALMAAIDKGGASDDLKAKVEKSLEGPSIPARKKHISNKNKNRSNSAPSPKRSKLKRGTVAKGKKNRRRQKEVDYGDISVYGSGKRKNVVPIVELEEFKLPSGAVIDTDKFVYQEGYELSHVNAQETSISTSESDGEEEWVIGLDFGTSSVKCVIQNSSRQQAWLVPFLEGDDEQAFILPARVYMESESYSLVGEGMEVANLKLPFIEKSLTDEHIMRIK